MEKTLELNFKSKRQWIKAVILGFLIGLAVILPGISGATIAIVFGLYSKMIYSFGNILKEFKKCFLFLLPIGLGLVFGFVLGFFFVQDVFEAQPFIVICLFAGLMIGSFPAVKDEIKGVKINVKRMLFFALGILIPICIGVLSITLNSTSADVIVPSIGMMFLYLCLGLVASLTQIVPGLSCSALLMAFGQFGAILASIHLDFLLQNPLVIVTLLMFGIGFLVGLVLFSKVLNKLFAVARDTTYTMIVGLSLGSIVTMFLNPDIYDVYTKWESVGVVFKNLGIGIALLSVGFVISYLLVRYQRKVDAEKEEKEEATKEDGDKTVTKKEESPTEEVDKETKKKTKKQKQE